MALPAGSDLAVALQQLLAQFPAKTQSRSAVPVQSEHTVSKSLNLSPGYASHFKSGVRELIQNWFDQCKVVAGLPAAVRVVDRTPPAAATRGELLLACLHALGPTGPVQCCGYLALCPTACDTCDIALVNYATTISLAGMTMGQSSKRDQALAGFFGEVSALAGSSCPRQTSSLGYCHACPRINVCCPAHLSVHLRCRV